MEEYYLMWLSRIEGIGFRRIERLMAYFGSAEAIWHADPREIRRAFGTREELASLLLSSRDEDILNGWIIELEEKEIAFYSYWHPAYPRLLREIYSPPVGIYVRGELPEDEIDTVAIIGARRCTRYGATVAHKIAQELAASNIIIVSGMARGIDSEAHKGILDGGGKTIAVLGCGVDICYPEENHALMERIMENGCVLSEFPPGTPPLAKHFPRRNRIIAGLSKIVIVVEAGKKSGTLITADYALDSGREVFVVPGNVTSALSQGTNDLIKQGCPVITEGNDILFELGIVFQEKEKAAFREKTAAGLGEQERRMYELIDAYQPTTAEALCRKLQMNIQEVQYMLSLLELSGYIHKLPQAGYIRESGI